MLEALLKGISTVIQPSNITWMEIDSVPGFTDWHFNHDCSRNADT